MDQMYLGDVRVLVSLLISHRHPRDKRHKNKSCKDFIQRLGTKHLRDRVLPMQYSLSRYDNLKAWQTSKQQNRRYLFGRLLYYTKISNKNIIQ